MPPRPGWPVGLSKPLLCRAGERLGRCRVPAAAPENPILTLGRDRPRLFLPAGRGSRSSMGCGGTRMVRPGGWEAKKSS